jgi:hypothetical protein
MIINNYYYIQDTLKGQVFSWWPLPEGVYGILGVIVGVFISTIIDSIRETKRQKQEARDFLTSIENELRTCYNLFKNSYEPLLDNVNQDKYLTSAMQTPNQNMFIYFDSNLSKLGCIKDYNNKQKVTDVYSSFKNLLDLTCFYREQLVRIIDDKKSYPSDIKTLQDATDKIIITILGLQKEKEKVFDIIREELYELDKKAHDKRQKKQIKELKKLEKKIAKKKGQK